MNERKKKYFKIQLEITVLENQPITMSSAYNAGRDDNTLDDPFA